MVKRNSAIDAIDALNSADLAAQEQKAANLRMIPLPEMVTDIEWERIFADKDFNVRDDSSYSFEENKELYHSLKFEGLKVMGGDNLSFSLQSAIDNLHANAYKVISGNVRYWMMTIIRNEEIKRRAENNEPASPETLPFARIFGLVFKGLTLEQEYDLMADHMLKKGLNEFEKCKEIGEFVHRTGLTYKRAGIKFGMDANKIARYCMRYSMPTVMGEYRKEKGKDKSLSYVSIGQKQLEALYTAYRADQSGGYGYREEGPNFRAAWETILANPQAFKAPSNSKPETQDRETILGHSKSVKATFGNVPEMDYVADILAWTANETRDGKPVNLLKAIESLATNGKTLRAEIEKLRAEVEQARSERAEAIASLASLTKDYEGAKAEVESLRAEVTTLKAKAKAKPNGAK